jgi:hypothetical protein
VGSRLLLFSFAVLSAVVDIIDTARFATDRVELMVEY